MDTREPIARRPSAEFEKRFRRVARRVLVERGYPPETIEPEIERLRRTDPGWRLPTFDELDAEQDTDHQ